MSICSRVEDAIFLYENGRYEGTFLSILVAVAATSRKEYPNMPSDREQFERFLNSRWRGVMAVEYRGECYPIPQIFYKWFRCELVHEGGLPVDIELLDTDAMSLRAGGHPEYVLKISRGWFHWLVQSVIQALCNTDDFAS
jgi:hypothetical protein